MSVPTVELIAERVRGLQRMAGDPEAAHVEVDSIYLMALRAIAIGAPDAQHIAKAALEAEAVEFERWYA